MSDIALYNTLRKIPDVSDDEAKEAVADIASSREVATRAHIAELKGELKSDIERMGRVMIMWMVGVGVAVAGIVIAVVG